MSLALLGAASVADKLPGGGKLPTNQTSAATSSSSGNDLLTGEFNPDFSDGGPAAQLPLLALVAAGVFVAWLYSRR